MTFPTSVIRKLARSEEGFAQTKTFHGLRIGLEGPVDADAMSLAFDMLLQAHPVLAGHLETGSDGRHQIVADDFAHPGVWVTDGEHGPCGASAEIQLDQSVALVNLELKIGAQDGELTLYSHHSMADGAHQFRLLEELFSWYTDAVCTGAIEPISPEPAPPPLEALLEERGIQKQRRSGLERFLPAMFAYDVPVTRNGTARTNLGMPVHIPVARCVLTREEARALAGFCRDRRVSVNAVVGAAILLAEWQVRDTPSVPIPYLYPVDLRYLLSPPVEMTGCTNAVGMAAYLAEIGPNTDAMDLAREIADAFRADLSEGVIQQSLLHFSPGEANMGLPNIVLCTDMGATPSLRTPPGLDVVSFCTEVHRASLGGVDLYGVGTFNERLIVEHHTQTADPHKPIELIHAQLRTIPSEGSWVAD
jgi:phenolphthiocerol/phthiocerol/phthiodiolone dimycocerosyl transferase